MEVDRQYGSDELMCVGLHSHSKTCANNVRQKSQV